MKKMLKAIAKFFGFGQDIPPYPIPFALITITPEASERGLKDDQNKIIILYEYNKFGNLQSKTYPYSQERVNAMEKIRKIPVYDKTQGEERFPVWAKTLPQEITYLTK